MGRGQFPGPYRQLFADTDVPLQSSDGRRRIAVRAILKWISANAGACADIKSVIAGSGKQSNVPVWLSERAEEHSRLRLSRPNLARAMGPDGLVLSVDGYCRIAPSRPVPAIARQISPFPFWSPP